MALAEMYMKANTEVLSITAQCVSNITEKGIKGDRNMELFVEKGHDPVF